MPTFHLHQNILHPFRQSYPSTPLPICTNPPVKASEATPLSHPQMRHQGKVTDEPLHALPKNQTPPPTPRTFLGHRLRPSDDLPHTFVDPLVEIHHLRPPLQSCADNWKSPAESYPLHTVPVTLRTFPQPLVPHTLPDYQRRVLHAQVLEATLVNIHLRVPYRPGPTSRCYTKM